MPAHKIVDMILEALRAMAIGVPGVFLVLAVFYFVLRALTVKAPRD